jgi:hypothetical protein
LAWLFIYPCCSGIFSGFVLLTSDAFIGYGGAVVMER